MTASSSPATPARPPRRSPQRPSLYTTVLSLAIAAIAATWLPFSVLYINALSKRPPAAAALTAHPTPAHPALSSPTPVTTRAS